MKKIYSISFALLVACTIAMHLFSGSAAAADYSSTYTYDEMGRVIGVRLNDGSSVDFAYDGVGNRTVVSRSPGTTAPMVAVTSPLANATGISPQVTVVVTFSRPINPATVTTGQSGTFRLTGPGNVVVAGTVSVLGLEVVFVPVSPLVNGAQYAATVTTGVRDLDNRPLVQQKVWSFTISASPDGTPPTVISVTPISGATNVPVTGTITALFSEALDPATVTTDSFLIMNGISAVSGTVSYNVATRVATLTPDIPLQPSTTYVTVLLPSIADIAGNRLAANREWTFTTASNGTPIVPLAYMYIPSAGETDVALRAPVGAIFYTAMDPATITSSTFTLKKGATVIPGTISYNQVKHQATLIPTTPLEPNTEYTVTLTTAIKDVVGTSLPSTVNWTFTTLSVPPFLVTCTLAGVGSGSIQSTSATIACGSGSCSGSFPQNSSVLLHPVPDATSLFAGWGAPCSGTSDCTFGLYANTTLLATFDLKPARIVGITPPYFTSLQAAYDEGASDKTIQSRAVAFGESLTCSQARNIVLKGGYDQGYTSQTDFTILNGILIIGRGALTVERFVVK